MISSSGRPYAAMVGWLTISSLRVGQLLESAFMHNSLDAIDSLFAFTNKHAKGLLDPSALLTEDQIAELATLDAEFYAWCQLDGLSSSIIPEPQDPGFRGFGNSKLPYVFTTVHVPIKDQDGRVTQETRGSGMMIFLTPEWVHALKSLRATAAALKAKAAESVQPPSKSTPSSAACENQGPGLDPTPGNRDKSAMRRDKPKRGRPAGRTDTQDHKLYLDWKAAYEETGMSKREFLRARGLPESDFYAIERGRKQERRVPGKVAGNNYVKPI